MTALSAQDFYAEADLARLQPGLVLFKVGGYEQAGITWSEIGQEIASQGRDPATLRLAGFAYVLATIAFEKDENARAYQTWGLSIQYFLQGQTRWEQEQVAIQQRLETLAHYIKAATASGGNLPISESDLTLMDLEQYLHLTTYAGPPPGLPEKNSARQEPPIVVAREYYARPLAEAQESTGETPEAAAYSRGGAPGRDTPEAAPEISTPFARGLPAASPEELSPKTEAWIPEDSILAQTGDSLAAPSAPVPGPGVIPLGSPLPVPPTPTDTAAEPVVETAVKRGVIIDTSAAETPVPDPDGDGVGNPEVVVTPHLTLPKGALTGQELTEADLTLARAAWRYFVTNRQSTTGLVNAVNGYTYATLWDIASAIAALVAAEQIGIIDRAHFEREMGLLLQTLSQIALYNDELPNREYDTRTGQMVDIRNRPSHKGSGWSALDIGRCLIWLKITELWYPQLAEKVHQVVKRWRFDRLAQDGEMHGVLHNGRSENIWQEGRLGYE
ncbi:MAG: DUF3131 domain-containing protein, partial [Calditrichaeota bacterium]